ncbi:MAG: hypothetical protein CVU85_07630 [Firmicutes bacterium HGW-Firmicutes-10]|nr:MAG: hypothetical protein CVU85_07630 [Firmicutes bacterium HGW-Firmicutes-10]
MDKEKIKTEEEKRIDRIYYSIFLFVLVFTLLAFIFTYIAQHLYLSYPLLQQFAVGSIDSWIQFLGSLLGGSLTLIALILTFQYTDKQRKDEKILNLMPVCIIRLSDSSRSSEQINNIFAIDIVNISENFSKDIRIEDFKVRYEFEVNGVISSDLHQIKSDDFEKIPNILPKKEYHRIKPQIPAIDDKKRDLYAKKAVIDVSISYTDIYSLKKYFLVYTLDYIVRDKGNGLHTSIDVNKKSRKTRVFELNKETNSHS